MRNKLGTTLLIIGGILMIISSAIGSIGIYELLAGLVDTHIPPNLAWTRPILYVLLEILRWIANTGGAAVIVGALLIVLNHYRFGKWLISIGLTFGTLALIIWLISWITDNTNIITDPQILLYLDNLEDFFTYNTGLQFTGVVIAIIGRSFVKKPKKPKEEEAEEVEEAEITEKAKESESGPPLPFQNIYCPNCGASIPYNAEFCSECGNTIERP